MHYAGKTAVAFDSVEHIIRNVNSGWLLRYAHANGASFFFIVVCIHIFRGLYYGYYKPPREVVWMLGLVILLLMMATAFMGYVLPWGRSEERRFGKDCVSPCRSWGSPYPSKNLVMYNIYTTAHI